MSSTITRRYFLATAGTISFLPRHVFAQGKRPGANGRLAIAGIGIGGMGKNNLHEIAAAGHAIVALCDVDSVYAQPVRATYPEAKFYTDYRELLDKEKDLDGVMIATPDHTHAFIAAAAIKAGKHVFVQKPLCHDVFECRELMRLAKEKNVVTQMGIQGHAGAGFYLINEWIAAGRSASSRVSMPGAISRTIRGGTPTGARCLGESPRRANPCRQHSIGSSFWALRQCANITQPTIPDAGAHGGISETA